MGIISGDKTAKVGLGIFDGRPTLVVEEDGERHQICLTDLGRHLEAKPPLSIPDLEKEGLPDFIRPHRELDTDPAEGDEQ